MKRYSTLSKVGMVVAGLAVALVGATALAERNFGPHAMQRHVTEFINGALDAAKADASQRAAIDAARDQAMTTLSAMHQQHHGEVKEMIALFESDTLDGAKVKSIEAARLADMTRAGDAIVTAITEAHRVLSPDQRRAVASYIRAHKPSRKPGFRGDMMKRMVESRLGDLLDKVGASDVQRTAIEAARDHVFATVDADVVSAESDLADRALTLFEADTLDPAQVRALRADHQARAARVADAVVQALHDVHDALTPAQRKQVVTEVHAQFARFGHHHGMGEGAASSGETDAAPATNAR